MELKLASEMCPSMPILFGNEDRSSQVKCRYSQECASEESCCFNGIGMNCWQRINFEKLKSKWESNKEHVAMLALNEGLSLNNSKCPLSTKLQRNPGCKSDCQTDAECLNRSFFLRCCSFGCGKRCQFITKTALTPCTYLQAAHWQEADKMSLQVNNPFGDVFIGRSNVQCTLTGDFESVQCDVSIG